MRMLVKAEKGEDSGDIPDEQPPVAHDIDYVIRTWMEHHIHHTYPRAGGYDDQDADLMDDWHILSMYYVRVERGIFTVMSMPTNGADWQTMMGG